MNKLEVRVRILAHTIILLLKYRPWGKVVKPMIIYMIDGSMHHHSGLADRIRQIMGIYAICKNRGYKFGLIANHPFELSNYLVPEYDWRITKENYSLNIFSARPLYLGFRSKEKYKSMLTLKKRQLHVYASIHWGLINELGYNMEQLFWELFDPIPEIKEFIRKYKEQYSSWDCVHFRFQNILGDFNEPKIQTLNESEKDNLRNKCFKYVFEESKRTVQPLLVCSDSDSFLQEVSTIPGVIILPGEPIHIDYTRHNNFEMHLKNFLDFFMISESESVRSVSTNLMYRSDFPALAASIKNVPFKRVDLD